LVTEQVRCQLVLAGVAAVSMARPEQVQAAGSWKCQMTSDGRPPAALAADGR
jgi:hypothetical protein